MTMTVMEEMRSTGLKKILAKPEEFVTIPMSEIAVTRSRRLLERQECDGEVGSEESLIQTILRRGDGSTE